MRLEYLAYRELFLRISKLKTTGASDETLEKLKRGAILTEILRQDKDDPVSQEIQVVIFYAFNKKILNELETSEVKIFQAEALAFCEEK